MTKSGRWIAGLAIVGLLGACGGGDDGDDEVATATTSGASATTTAAADGKGRHPCDIIPLADAKRLTRIEYDKTERTGPTSKSPTQSCVYSLKDPPGTAGGARSATLALSIIRSNGSQELGNGGFLQSLRATGTPKHPIPGGIPGATQTGSFGSDSYSQAAAQFGDERIVYVSSEANAFVTKGTLDDYDAETNAVEVLKEFLARGA